MSSGSDNTFVKALGGFVDLVAASALAGAAVAVAFAPTDAADVAVRTLFALPLVLVIPGYALLAAVLPSLERWSAGGLAYSLGLSLSIAILAGLALNYTSWGIERRPLTLALAGFTLAAVSTALVRSNRGAGRREARMRIGPTRGQVFLLAVALLLVAAAVGITRLGAVQAERRSTFTQLWMLPAQGRPSAARTSLRVGIRNDEGTTEAYRLLVRVGARRLALWRSIVLDSGEQQVKTVVLPADLSERRPVEAELFRDARPHIVYRHVTYWPPPSAPPPSTPPR